MLYLCFFILADKNSFTDYESSDIWSDKYSSNFYIFVFFDDILIYFYVFLFLLWLSFQLNFFLSIVIIIRSIFDEFFFLSVNDYTDNERFDFNEFCLDLLESSSLGK